MGYIHEVAKSRVVVRAWVGKEFPDLRQNERRLEFIRAGEGASWVFQLVMNLPAMQETLVQSLGQRDLLEKG